MQVTKFQSPLDAGRPPSDADLKKLESLFAKAAKAANTAAQAQKSPATTSGVQRSLPSGTQYMMGDDTTDVTSIDMYDQRSYTNFGWVAIHNVLTKMERGSLRSQFADAVANKYSYPRAKSGEYMIAVGDFSDPVTVGKYSYRDRYTNKVVFVSGTMDNPIISQVIEVDHLAPGAVSYYVGGLIKYERTDFDFIEFAESVARQAIFIRRRCEDFSSYSELRRAQQDGRSVQDRNTDRGDQQQRRGSGAPSDGSTGVSYSLPTGELSADVAQGAEDEVLDFEATVEGLAVDEEYLSQTYRVTSDEIPAVEGADKYSESQYIEKMLEDPAIPQNIRRIFKDARDDKKLRHVVMTAAKRKARASAILKDADRVDTLIEKVLDGQALTAVETEALQTMMETETDSVKKARIIRVIEFAATESGRALATVRHSKDFASMDSEKRRGALIQYYQEECVQAALDVQKVSLDEKFHNGAGEYAVKFVEHFARKLKTKRMNGATAETIAEEARKLVATMSDPTDPWVEAKEGKKRKYNDSQRVRGQTAV